MDILIFSSLKEISQSLSDSFFKNQICSKSKKRFLEKEIAKEILLRSLQVFYGYTSSILPEIKLNKYGKPYFKDNFYPFYNISHSEDFIIIGFSDNFIGVDIELIKNNRNIHQIAKRFYTEEEYDFVKEQNFSYDIFYTIWVLIESISKYIGKGFSSFNKDFSIIPSNNSVIVNKKECRDKITIGSLISNDNEYKFAYVAENQNLPKIYFYSNSKFIPINEWQNISIKYSKLDFGCSNIM